MSINRRDATLGVITAGAFGVSEWLRPRRELNLLGNGDLEKIVPRTFGKWSSSAGGDFVVPESPSSLASRLYTKQLMRAYRANSGAVVRLVIAYGSSQSDALQLHRPESCYSAVGFTIQNRRLLDIPIVRNVAIPAVSLGANAEDRTEDVLYWTRLGESLPQTAARQRQDRLTAALAGYVGDGVLVRASISDPVGASSFDLLAQFFRELIIAVPREGRAALIGSIRSAQLAK